jgi:hypothetical protein
VGLSENLGEITKKLIDDGAATHYTIFLKL